MGITAGSVSVAADGTVTKTFFAEEVYDALLAQAQLAAQFPTGSAGAPFHEALGRQANALAAALAPRVGGGQELHFGATFDLLTNYARTNGDSTIADVTTISANSRHIVRAAGTITSLVWSSAAADSTTRMKVWLNGIAGDQIALTGTGGVVVISLAVAAAVGVALEWDAGTAPGASTWTLGVEAS